MRKFIAIVSMSVVLLSVFASTCFANENVAEEVNTSNETSEVVRYYDDNGVYRETLSDEALARIQGIKKDANEFKNDAENLVDSANQIKESTEDTKNSRSLTTFGVVGVATVLFLKNKKNSSKEKKEKLQKKEKPVVVDEDPANA